MSLGGGSSVGSGDDGGSVGSATWALSISTTVLFDDAPSSDISPCRPRCSRRPPQHHHDYQQVAASSTSSVGSLGSVGSAHATTRLVSTALFVATARAPATSGRPSGRRRRPSPGAPCWGPGGYRRVGPARARHTPRRNRTRPTLTWSTQRASKAPAAEDPWPCPTPPTGPRLHRCACKPRRARLCPKHRPAASWRGSSSRRDGGMYVLGHSEPAARGWKVGGQLPL